MAADGENGLTCELHLECEHGELNVHALRGHEDLSTPFRYEIDFSTNTLDIDKATRSGVRATLRDGFGHERHLAGVIDELQITAAVQGWLRCRIVVVPFAALLRHTLGCRIFQDQSVPDIVAAVFAAHGVKSSTYRIDVRKPHPPRVYCVQYQESSWDFINRLLEEEGIYYWFEQGDKGAVMAMTDDKEAAPKSDPDVLGFYLDTNVQGSELRVTVSYRCAPRRGLYFMGSDAAHLERALQCWT